jgi:hypothetical protein
VAVPPPESAILFLDAGAHVDMQHPAVRIVQTDSLERFAAGLLKPDVYIDPEKLRRVVDGLTNPASEPEMPGQAAFADLDARDLPPAEPGLPSRLPQVSSQEPEFIQRIAKKTAFTRRQWILLAGLLVVNIMILIVVILVAMVYVYR